MCEYICVVSVWLRGGASSREVTVNASGAEDNVSSKMTVWQ